MKKVFGYLYLVLDLLLIYFFSRGLYLFLWKNEAIIKRYTLMQVLLWLVLADFVGILILNTVLRYTRKTAINLSVRMKGFLGLFVVILNGIFIITFLQTALFDYFQPFSIYDPAIYSILYGIIVLLLKSIIDIIRSFVCDIKEYYFLPQVDILLLLLIVFIWGVTQSDYEIHDGENVIHLFVQGDNDYGTYRIPSILVLPEGTTLDNGTTLHKDRIVVFAEARKNGSVDHGNIDMVYAYSDDHGATWSTPKYLDLGDNKLGNFTPVYDEDTGIIHMMHMRTFYDGSGTDGAYMMTSLDGGVTWSEGELLFPGLKVGPGHGIQLVGGTLDGRLLVPGYGNGGFLYYSDDHGETWNIGGSTDEGDEASVAQIDLDTIVLATRHEFGMALAHGDMYKLFSISRDGGNTFEPTIEHEDVPTPLCMTGLTSLYDVLYYSGPLHHQARANLTLLASRDDIISFTELLTIYEGPSGYSDIGVLSNGTLVILFENGAVEYDERLTFMVIDIS